MTVADYSRAQLDVLHLQGALEAFFERYDLLLTPTTAVTSFPVGKYPGVIGGRGGGALLGIHSIHMCLQHDHANSGQRAVRLLLRWNAHRPPHHRTPGMGDNRAASLGSFRAG